MGGESEAAWRALLDDLVKRGLRTPELIIADSAPGLEKALAALWPDAPVQRSSSSERGDGGHFSLPTDFFLQIIQEEADHAREDIPADRLRRGEQNRLDARLPFAPAQFRRQVEQLAVKVEFGVRLARHVSEPIQEEGSAAGELARGAKRHEALEQAPAGAVAEARD